MIHRDISIYEEEKFDQPHYKTALNRLAAMHKFEHQLATEVHDDQINDLELYQRDHDEIRSQTPQFGTQPVLQHFLNPRQPSV